MQINTKPRAHTIAIISILLSFLIKPILLGQQKLKLSDCIDIALENRVELKNADVEIQNAEYSVSNAELGFIPSINASFTHNINHNEIHSPVLENYSSTFSLNGNTMLFNWFNNWKKVKLANISLNRELSEAEYSMFDITGKVIESFFTVLFSHEQLVANRKQLDIADSILTYTEKLFELGKIMQNDVEESKLQLIQERKSLLIAQKNYDLAIIKLNNTLQTKDSLDLDYTFYESIKTESDTILKNYNIFEKVSVENNPYLKILNLHQSYLKGNHQIIRAKNLPTLSLDYSLTVGYSSFQPWAEGGNWESFLQNSYSGFAGLRLTIPIFNNREIKTQILLSENDIRKHENTIESEYMIIINSLKNQFFEAKYTNEQLTLAEQELLSIRTILSNRMQLYSNGKDNIFTVLSYKKQFNEIENAHILLRYETLLKKDLLRLYYLGEFIE